MSIVRTTYRDHIQRVVPPVEGAFDSYAELPRSRVNFAMPTASTTITVKASGGDHTTLQAAWNALTTAGRTANTEIVVDAEYSAGSLTTGAQAGDGSYWCVIRSSGSGSLPRHVRVGTGDTANMFFVNATASPTIFVGADSRRIRFVGLHMKRPDGTSLTSMLVTDHTSSYIIIDRSLFDGNYTAAATRYALGLSGTHMGVIDSYMHDVHQAGTESKAILVTKGLGPYTFVNNFLEAGAISILFGGSAAGGLVPQDITFTRNYCYRRPAWRPDELQIAVKNNFEIKHADRCLVEHNAFENHWYAAQDAMMNLKMSDYDGTSYTQHVCVRYNSFEHWDSPLKISNFSYISVHDNDMFMGGLDNPYRRASAPRGLMIYNTLYHLDYSHNRVVGDPAGYGAGDDVAAQVVTSSTTAEDLIFENNILGEATYGFTGAGTLDEWAPRHSVVGNILAPATWNTSLPSGNCITWPPPALACPDAGVRTSRHAASKTGNFASDPWES